MNEPIFLMIAVKTLVVKTHGGSEARRRAEKGSPSWTSFATPPLRVFEFPIVSDSLGSSNDQMTPEGSRSPGFL